MSVKAQRTPLPWVRLTDTFERDWPGASAIATGCSLNLIGLADAINARAHEWANELGIPSVAAANVLAILRGAGEPLLPSVIADSMIVTRSNITGVIGTLERRELVRRFTNARDGRQRPVAITPEGDAAILRLQGILHRADQELFGVLGIAGQTRLLAALASLQTAIPRPGSSRESGRH